MVEGAGMGERLLCLSKDGNISANESSNLPVSYQPYHHVVCHMGFEMHTAEGCKRLSMEC